MVFEYQIHVPLKIDAAQDVRGARFERLVQRYLAMQSYKIKERYRHAGGEIDLLVESTLTGDLAYVECKARKEAVSSQDVSTIFANLFQRDARLGLIFYISKLGRETESKADDLQDKSDKRLKFFGPKEIVQFLIDSGSAKLPNSAGQDSLSRDLCLVVLDERELWVLTRVNQRGERVANLAFDAQSGHLLNGAVCPDLTETDWQLGSLPWGNTEFHQSKEHDHLKVKTRQTVAKVNSSTKWLDFLPSNPRDFVGRSETVQEFSQYLDTIAVHSDAVRVVGIKGSSGWGKSSFCLKVSNFARSKAIHSSYILPVDCRAATDFNFADLAFSRLLEDAASDGFILPIFKPLHESIENPFSTNEYSALFSELRASKRSIGVIFDQFEEIIHVDDQQPLFHRLKLLSLLIDDLKAPIFIGFSWKTDGSVGTDNPGYQLWHGLSDRRRDFVIRAFNRRDSEEFITKAAAAENKRISGRNIEILIEQGNGYPWLLKKLTVRLINNSNSSTLSPGISESDIKEILEDDLNDLGEKQRSALRYIAERAPVESYVVAEHYSEDTLTDLINRRLVVRTGNKVTIYWDIFREFILSNKVPVLQTTYVYALSIRKLTGAIRNIAGKKQLSYSDFAVIMGVSNATADNFIRDLWHMGVLFPHRSEYYFDVKIQNYSDGISLVFQFLVRHAIFKVFQAKSATHSIVRFSDVKDELTEIYAFINPSEATIYQYFRRIMALGEACNKVKRRGTGYAAADLMGDAVDALSDQGPTETELFRAHAPVEKVLELARLLCSGPVAFQELRGRKLRNAVYALNTLGLSKFNGDRVVLHNTSEPWDNVVESIRSRALRQDSVVETIKILNNYPEIRGRELGERLNDLLKLAWSQQSCARYGSALKAWANWLRQEDSLY